MTKELREYNARKQWQAAANQALQDGRRFYMFSLRGIL